MGTAVLAMSKTMSPLMLLPGSISVSELLEFRYTPAVTSADSVWPLWSSITVSSGRTAGLRFSPSPSPPPPREPPCETENLSSYVVHGQMNDRRELHGDDGSRRRRKDRHVVIAVAVALTAAVGAAPLTTRLNPVIILWRIGQLRCDFEIAFAARNSAFASRLLRGGGAPRASGAI